MPEIASPAWRVVPRWQLPPLQCCPKKKYVSTDTRPLYNSRLLSMNLGKFGLRSKTEPKGFLKKFNKNVVWMSDPMHGNTQVNNDGYKIRKITHIEDEIKMSFSIHAQHGSKLSGIHLEITANDIHECLHHHFL